MSQTTDWADDDREDAPKPATNTDKNVKEGGKENEKKESGSGSQGPLHESKYDVQVTLADQQADPNSPLYSVKSFDDLGLHADLLKGIYAMKYTKPSKIQELSLIHI